MIGALNEEELGLPRSSLEEVVELVRQLPFEPAMLLLARLAAALWESRTDVEEQLRLVEEMNMPNLHAAIQDGLARGGEQRRVIFAEQYLTALERLLVDYAFARRIDEEVTEAQLRGVIAAYFGTTTVVSDADAHLREGEPPPDEWLTYLIKNGVYNTRPALANVLTRYHELLDVLPEMFVGHPQFCPIRDWMTEVYGLTPVEQHAVGFYSYAMTNVLDENAQTNERSLISHPFGRSELADRVDRIESLLSASRGWYQEAFARLGETADSIAWERRPFLQRPFLRLEDGRWILLFPRAIESWLGEGLHYRALDAATEKGESRRYNNFFGHLVERYCLDLAQSAYPVERPVGAGRAHPEQPYGRRGGKRTFDIAIDFGTDLLAIEAVAARITAEMQVFGRPEVLTPELEKMLLKKVAQIGPPIAAVLSGDALIPDVDPAQIERVWPIVVTAGSMMVTELLWDRIRAAIPEELETARVQPLSVLDLDDFEMLLAVGASGEYLPDVLRMWKEGPFRDLDFMRFAHEELDVDPALRLPIIDERWTMLGEKVRAALFPHGG